MDTIIYGRNPVLEAVNAGFEIDRVLIMEGASGPQINQIIAVLKEKNILFRFTGKKKLDQLSENHNHQGVLAFVAAHKYCTVDEILAKASEMAENPLIVIADGLSDPHNLGSIIRTANAAGAHGIIIPKNRSVSLNATVLKVSAGAALYTPVARVTNISSTIDYLKENGVWITGTGLSDNQNCYEADFKGPTAIVIGSEDKGISRLVSEKCDFMVKIPMIGEIQSLNASVAAGVLLYEAVRQRLS